MRMVEERSFENPKFARAAVLWFAPLVGLVLITYLVAWNWESPWPYLLTMAVMLIAVQYAVKFLFWKFAGVPMREPRKTR
jgi:hypothetical protein